MEVRDLYERHPDETILVIGGGVSVNNHTEEELGQFTTIGMNQGTRKMLSDYHLLLDPPWCHSRQAGLSYPLRAVRNTHTFVTKGWQYAWRKEFEFREVEPYDMTVLEFFLRNGWRRFERPHYLSVLDDWINGGERIPYHLNSCGVAVWLAIYMGACRVGILGLDYTKGYFWNPQRVFTRKPVALQNARWSWGRLHKIAREVFDVEIFNLSPQSLINTLPRANLEEWQPAQQPGPSSTAESETGPAES